MGAGHGPEVGVTLGSRRARRPQEALTMGRQRVGVPETGRPRAADGEDRGDPRAKKREEPGVPWSLWKEPALLRPVFSPV